MGEPIYLVQWYKILEFLVGWKAQSLMDYFDVGMSRGFISLAC